MLEKLEQTIRLKCQINTSASILLGISGGADSLFMLDILHRLGYPLIVAHLDHQLRPESGQEAVGVRKIAENLEIPYIFEIKDANQFAKAHKLSIEQAARQIRYEFLFRQAERLNAQAVAVAHTADDQIETILLHLLRGTGLSGLTGMQHFLLPSPWSQNIPLIRPILDIWREQIIEYIQFRPYQPFQDKSNWDTTYLRNRIRHELLPSLESYNPQIRQNIHQMAAIISEDEQIIHKISSEAWQKCLLAQGAGYIQLDKNCFLGRPMGIQRRLVRRAHFELLSNLVNIEFQHIEQVIAFIASPSTSKFSQLAAGLFILDEENTIFIFDQHAQLPKGYWPQICNEKSFDPSGSGKLNLDEVWELHYQIKENTPEIYQAALSNSDLFQAWLDYDRIKTPLIVRGRLPGDQFRPLGLVGKKIKLSDFFIDQKLPHRARANWPLVISIDEIVWASGFQIAYRVRLTPQTKRILYLRITKRLK